MKQRLILYVLLICAFPVYAQKEYNTWYFGKGAVLDFNYFPPRTSTVNTFNSIEGCASLSDKNGRILFYTNGVRVFNKNNKLMPNGNFLAGDPSSTNGVIIAPLPGQDSIYYLFNISGALVEDQQVSYSIVDMREDGGNGDVTIKNVFIEDETFEKIAGVKHCDGKKTWIIIRKWNTDEYHSYLLTPAGLDPVPVVSHTGFVVNGFGNNAIGTLKSSVDGKKLVAVHSFHNDLVELMDFDNATGAITNPIIFKPNTDAVEVSFTGVYGAEFSPDSRLLYVSSNVSLSNPSTLYQFDITSHNAATILATKQIIAQTTPWDAGSLQIGPDKRIYMAMWNDSAVSVIENPNVAGTGCNFKFNAISFGSTVKQVVQYGLPTFIQSNFDVNTAPFDFTRSGKCVDPNVQFTISRTTGLDSVRWFFGDGLESTVLSPLHTYTSTGYFDVKLVVYKKDCSGFNNDTVDRRIWIAPDENFLDDDISSCAFKDVNIIATANVDDANYLWSTGDITTDITVSAPGKYWFRVNQNGCIASDTINLLLAPTPIVTIEGDTTVCLLKPAKLKAVSSILPATYVWSTGETTPEISTSQKGEYTVTVTANCAVEKKINIVTGDCEVVLPNTFTPDGNGRNDEFGVLSDFLATNFSMTIFDRWGNIIFKSNSLTKRWDGKYKGKQMPDGNYPWIISYINGMGYTKRLKGYVLMLH